MTSPFLAAACWRNLGRFVASRERLCEHTVLPSQAQTWHCLLRSLGMELGSAHSPLAKSCSCQELSAGAAERKVRPGRVAWGVGWVGAGMGTSVPHQAGWTCPPEPQQPVQCWSSAAGRVRLCQLAVQSSRHRQPGLLVVCPDWGIAVPANATCASNSGEAALPSRCRGHSGNRLLQPILEGPARLCRRELLLSSFSSFLPWAPGWPQHWVQLSACFPPCNLLPAWERWRRWAECVPPWAAAPTHALPSVHHGPSTSSQVCASISQ